MIFPFEKILNSEKETIQLAKDFASILKDGDVVYLNGDLGTGKTFFVKSICVEYGISNASSPSFAIVNEYSGLKKIVHFDFYRIRKAKELIDIGFYDYLNEEVITFIEWAELYPEVLPHKYFEVKFEYLTESSRKVTLKKNG